MARLLLCLLLSAAAIAPDGAPKQAIAHRGASGYAPEHSLAAYRLAIEQKADFVEPDLAVTKDNVLICLHDDTLERTSNIAAVFPDRPSANVPTSTPGQHWLVNDRRARTIIWFVTPWPTIRTVPEGFLARISPIAARTRSKN